MPIEVLIALTSLAAGLGADRKDADKPQALDPWAQIDADTDIVQRKPEGADGPFSSIDEAHKYRDFREESDEIAYTVVKTMKIGGEKFDYWVDLSD